MKRTLKALGLAAVAALALSAVLASAAQAEENADFSASNPVTGEPEYPATIDVTGEENDVQEFTVEGLPTLTCQNVHSKGTLEEEDPLFTAEFNDSDTEAWTECHVVRFGFTFPVTVHMNGCDFHFNAGTYTNVGAGLSHGSAEIKCEEVGQEITITIFKAGAETHPEGGGTIHTDVDRRCTIHVPPQQVQGSITFRNIETPGGLMAVTVEPNNATVEATVTNAENVVCEKEVFDPEADYVGNAIAEATNAAGEFIDTTVTGTP